MFVFKAAVVGAGAMGGEIAQTIASAEIPVVLKDVDQKFVDAGLEKARSLWQGRVDAGKMEAAERDRKLALITGATDYAGVRRRRLRGRGGARSGWRSSRRSSPSSTR